MKIHYIQHVPFEGPAYIAAIAGNNSCSIGGTKMFAGEKLPSFHEFDILFVLGGPMSVHDTADFPWITDEMRFIDRCITARKGVIGICLGAQMIAGVLGASVRKNIYREIGWYPVTLTAEGRDSQLFKEFPESFQAFHWHGETFDIPGGCSHLAASEACRNQAFSYGDRVAALQFHLESMPGSVDQLIRNCGDELDGTQWVQGVDRLMDTAHFNNSNKLMERLVASVADVVSS